MWPREGGGKGCGLGRSPKVGQKLVKLSTVALNFSISKGGSCRRPSSAVQN
ncbi:MAG: hypothetical protein ACKESB_00390 [Candidatus Hodgkinia cicadicola]